MAVPAPVVMEDDAGPDRPSWESTVIRDIMVGRTIGEYKIKRRVGNGGMGIVYEAIHKDIGRRVAIKVLRPELARDAGRMEDLLKEARAANAISHRGLIDIFGFGTIDGLGQYIVMEFLNGTALDEELKTRGRLPEVEAMEILSEALDAVGAAHFAGVVHRDLKPSNIFLASDGSGRRYVKVLDFGLAKQGSKDGRAIAQTRDSVMVGTPEYMAPEQASGTPISASSDIYAMGCVAFEMITGQLVFSGETPMAIAVQHVTAQPPRVRDVAPEVPAVIDELVARMLSKDPAERPSSAAEIREELAQILVQLGAGSVSSGVRGRVSGARASSPPPVSGSMPGNAIDQSARPTGRIAKPRRFLLPVVGVVGLVVAGVAGIVVTRSNGSSVKPLPQTPVVATVAGGDPVVVAGTDPVVVGEDVPVGHSRDVPVAVERVEPTPPTEEKDLRMNPDPIAEAKELVEDPVVNPVKTLGKVERPPVKVVAAAKPPVRFQVVLGDLLKMGRQEIWIDGKLRGHTPGADSSMELPVGAHRVQLKKNNTVTFDETLQFKPKQDKKLRVSADGTFTE